MRVDHRENELENHDRGLDYDLPRLLQRRGMLKLVIGAGLAGTGLVSFAACADDTTGTAAPPTGPEGAPTGAGGPPDGGDPGGGAAEPQQTSDTANGELLEETAGPYPGDGSNGPNLLTESGIVRSDITSSFGSSTTKAQGVPLAVTMTIKDFAASQIALLEETCKAVYATSGYEQSVRNLGRVSLDRDNVFGDGYDLQLPTITGDPTTGYQLTFECAV